MVLVVLLVGRVGIHGQQCDAGKRNQSQNENKFFHVLQSYPLAAPQVNPTFPFRIAAIGVKCPLQMR